jgi:phosphatidylserine/phosphatidylglycerophosphate/cardiolipin synthase-like enzyme
MVDQAVYFETAKSFIAPAHKPALEKAFLSGLESGQGAPTVKADRYLLILGHADQVGSRQSNMSLSERRALAALAVFELDEAAWNEFYKTESWRGKPEIETMSRAVDPETNDAIIAHYQANEAARLNLIRRYLNFLRPYWIPQQSPPIKPAYVRLSSPPDAKPIIPCSTDHPVINAPNVATAENRRAEFFYFRIQTPGLSQVSPPPPVYKSWRQVSCSGRLIQVYIYIRDEYGDPYKGKFDLTLPTFEVLINESTDDEGNWTRSDMPSGKYTIYVEGREITCLPDGTKSSQSYEKNLHNDDREIYIRVIDLNKWFVPKQNPISRIPQYTRGNIVKPLVDGQVVMAAVNAAFLATGSSDHYIYITGWRIDANTRLLGALVPTSEVLDVIINAIGRGVEVRALFWDALYTQNTYEQEEIDDEDRTPRGEAILDNETLGWYGSHHQKAIVVNGPGGLVGFCGGIDLAFGRWDTPDHIYPDNRRENFPDNPKPWHDVHTRIRGPAAGDIETNFHERWNHHPDRNDNGRTNVPLHPVPGEISNGPHLVQILRTFPPRQRYPFAPNGELGILNAYEKAISNAREYIYIEDQFFVSEEIADAIAGVMKKLKGKVMVVIPRETEEFRDAFWYHRYQIIDRLKRIDSSKIEVYYLTNSTGQEIFVHAKLMIIDDIWTIIGSANINRRSMTHDSEISAAVIDGAVEKKRSKFARDLRFSLWCEHLQVEKGTIDDPIEGIEFWPKDYGQVKGRVHVYPYHELQGDDPIFFDWDDQIDPDGR